MYQVGVPINRLSRTPRWVRGLKLRWNEQNLSVEHGRTPRWVRGLK